MTCEQKFRDTYRREPEGLSFCPYRVCPIGAHVDHQLGKITGFAIDKGIHIAYSPKQNGVIELSSLQFGKRAQWHVRAVPEEKQNDWADYLRGATKELYQAYPLRIGLSGVIEGSLPIGGLSSSAAFETLIGTIIAGLYNNMEIDPVTIAKAGQIAENEFFGKPCGLMDQMACSVGNMVHIDFKNPADPVIEKIDFDFARTGYSLCITDTKGSHSDLTHEYAAVPSEMKEIAKLLGHDVLRPVTLDDILDNITELRAKAGDRAVLRAIHFVEEDARVTEGVNALKENDLQKFLKVIRASGNSSFKYLQNVYTSSDVKTQNVSIALAVSDAVLEDDECSRVHGGGFAGTIQAFVKNENTDKYRQAMDKIFGEGSCRILKIRKYGGIKVL